MEEAVGAVAASSELVGQLIEVIPYAGATLLMLIMVFAFVRWMLKQNAKLNEIQLEVIRENTKSNVALTKTVEHLIDFCHRKACSERPGDDGG